MRPEIIINAAMSVDGKIAVTTGKQTRISSDEDMRRVKELRNSVDAILVGVGTVIADDPRLTTDKGALRVVLDTNGRTPPGSEILRTPPPTMIALGEGHDIDSPDGVEKRWYPMKDGMVALRPLLEDLYKMGVRRLLVEGGGTVIWSFISNGLFDILHIFMADMIIGGNAPSLVMGEGADTFEKIIPLKFHSVERIMGGLLLTYLPPPEFKTFNQIRK